MKVTFTDNYDWKVPGVRAWIAFKKGDTVTVTHVQGRDAIAAGVAKEVASNGRK